MRYRRLMELFEQAVSLPDEERSTLLAALQREEPTLAVDLRALLAQDDRQGDTLDSRGGRIGVALTQWGDALSASAPGTEPAEDAGPDPLLGSDVAARYRLDELLGIGGMGRVYRAFDRVEERFVAVKLLHARLIHDVHQIQRFRREFRAVSRLSHPGCLSVLAEGCHQEQRYIVMEYVPGGNLGRLAGAPDDTLLPVLIQLAEALDYVHRCRILHRDLKPANVLLTAEEPPMPKLADFGIVQMLDETETRLTDTGAMLGSIDFMAPEQFQGRALDPRCDLYSLGCIIYSLWAGQPPFAGTPFQRMWARFEREAPRLRELSPRAPERLDALVARLLQRDRDGRPQRAGEVARELSRVLGDVNGGALSARCFGPWSAPAPGAYLYRPGFFGRASLVDTLVVTIEEAALGPKSQIIAIYGAAGLGKTTLMNELGRRLARRGCRALTIACRSDDLTPFAPFAPGIAVLDEALGPTTPTALGSAHEGKGHGRSQLPADLAVVARRKLAREIAYKLLALHERVPAVLIVEDLHLAEAGSVELLEDLLAALDREGGGHPVLVATARPPARERLEAAPGARERVVPFVLAALDPEAVRQIAAAMLAIEEKEVPERLAADLAEACGGNPLWVQSAVRALVDRGHLRPTLSGWTLEGEDISSVLRVAIGDLLRAELASFEAPTRAVLAAAALVGTAVDVDLLCQVVGASEDAVIDALDEAMRASVVRRVSSRSSDDEYVFEHDLLAEVFRGDLAAPERALRHDAIGAALERRGTASAATLAFHFARGTDRERAFHHLRHAGLTAFDAHDYEAASRLLDEAIERVDSLPRGAREAARTACTESLADALISSGRTREGIDRLRRLTAGTAPIGTRARWMRKLGVALLRTPDVAEGLATLEGALSLLGDEVPRRRRRRYLRMVCDATLTFAPRVFGKGHVDDPVSEERAVIHRELALMHRWIDLDRAGFHMVAFIRLAYRLGVDAYLVEAYIGTAFIVAMNAWPRLAAFFHGKARELSRRTDDMSGLVRLEIVRAGIETLLGRDAGAAASCFAEGLRVAESLGDRFLMNFALSMRGWAGLLVGRAAQAAEDFRRAEALAAELDIPWLRDDTACGRSMVDLLQGDAASVARAARGVLTSDTRLALPVFEALPNEIIGAEAFVAGRFREAISYFERAREHYSAHHLERAWGTLAKLLCSEALFCLLDEEGARAAPELLEKLRDMVRMARRHYRAHLFRGCSALLNGVYRARRGEERTARALFARALAERGEAPEITVFDIWVKVRIAFERARLGDPSAPLAAMLDEADAACLRLGLGGMRSWLLRMRAVHRV